MNVRVWLRGLGLGRYEEKFRENKIDFDVLADLTDGDLRELGVPLGDRRRLLRAIAELGSQQPRTAQALPTPPAPAPAQSFAQLDSAERRPITVMFCDLVGSTELAAALDVEDWRNLVNTYLDEASKAVTRLGGHVLKRLGDGLMGGPHELAEGEARVSARENPGKQGSIRGRPAVRLERRWRVKHFEKIAAVVQHGDCVVSTGVNSQHRLHHRALRNDADDDETV